MIGRTNTTNYYSYKFIKSVPDEFQVVRYLGSDGLSYIDTDLSSHSNMSAHLKFEFVEVPSDGCVIGTKYNKGNRDRLYFYHYFKGHRLGYVDYFGSGVATIGEKYDVKTRLDVGNQYIYVNDELIYQGADESYLNTRMNFYIFDLNTSGVEVKYSTKVKLYFCKIWDGDEIERYYIPVYRKLDNLPGLYDIIHQVFYINKGTGNFNLGEDSEFDINSFDCSRI